MEKLQCTILKEKTTMAYGDTCQKGPTLNKWFNTTEPEIGMVSHPSHKTGEACRQSFTVKVTDNPQPGWSVGKFDQEKEPPFSVGQ